MNKKYKQEWKNEGYGLATNKKKPSALLVYLTLEQNARSKETAMGRPAIIAYIQEHFGGIVLSPKTVSESVNILKGLSTGPHALLNFHQVGKNGYYLGSAHSLLHPSEVLGLLQALENISPASSERLFSALKPALREEDASFIARIRQLTPVCVKEEDPEDKRYFQKIAAIAQAINDHHDIVFDHSYSDIGGQRFCETKQVVAVPFYFFSKRGQYYLLCGRMEVADGILSHKGDNALYVAAVDSMENVRESVEESIVRIEDCQGYHHFSLQEVTTNDYYVREGDVRGSWLLYEPPTKVEIHGERALKRIKAIFGKCFRVSWQGEENCDGVVEPVFRLHLYVQKELVYAMAILLGSKFRVLQRPEIFYEAFQRKADLALGKTIPGSETKSAQ